LAYYDVVKSKSYILTGAASKGVPATVAVTMNVIHECEVLINSPWTSPEVRLIFLALNGGAATSPFNIHSLKWPEELID
jgi:hypothetical protein